MFSANEGGEVIINPIDKEKIKEVAVSAIGYFPVILEFTNKKTKTIVMRLLKDYKELTNVTVSSGGMRSIYCGSTSSMQFIIRKPLLKAIESTYQDIETFPNPVNRNQTLQIKHKGGIKGIIQLFSGTGNLMFSQKINSQTNLIQVPITPSYSPGVYFLKLVDENNQVSASEKIIIQ